MSRTFGFRASVVTVSLLAAAACGSSSPTSPSPGPTGTSPTSMVLRGSVAGDPAVVGSGLRLVAESGSVAIDPRGQFSGTLANAPTTLRLVGPNLDAAVRITSGSGQVTALELTLELRGSTVVTLLACTTTAGAAGTNSLELKACVTGPS